MNKRRVPFNDADYLSKLSREDREWYQTFIAEHYYGRQSKDLTKRILNQDQIREAWREQNSQRRDAQWRASFECVEAVFTIEETVIRIIDAQLPLHFETIFGVLMEKKDPKALEYALTHLTIAAEVVGDHVGNVKDSAKVIDAYKFLLEAKADVEKQLAQAGE